jgi:hypothetical protein
MRDILESFVSSPYVFFAFSSAENIRNFVLKFLVSPVIQIPTPFFFTTSQRVKKRLSLKPLCRSKRLG